MRLQQGQCQPTSPVAGPRQLSLFDELFQDAAEAPGTAVRVPGRPAPEEILAATFSDRLAGIVWTANRLRIASVKPEHPGSPRLILRLHESFKQAPSSVLRAVGSWATGRRGTRRKALDRLRAFFDQTKTRQEAHQRRGPEVSTAVGRVFNLDEIFAQINRHYFEGQVQAAISWGRDRSTRPRRQRTILLGSFSYELGLIRIHPRLDRANVPRVVVESVVHHEMVHAFLPRPSPAARRALHSPEFRQLEQQFSGYEEAREWISKHLPTLLRACKAE